MKPAAKLNNYLNKVAEMGNKVRLYSEYSADLTFLPFQAMTPLASKMDKVFVPLEEEEEQEEGDTPAMDPSFVSNSET